MNRKPLGSSCIKSVGYDPKSKVLELEFQAGGIYRYSNIPKEVYKALMEASSPGKFFHQNIKSAYPSEMLEGGAPPIPALGERTRGLVDHLNCPYCGESLAIERGRKHYRCPSCGKKLELLKSRYGLMRFYREAPRLINRTCPSCRQWAVYAEQRGLPRGYKRWVCRNCGYVVGVAFGHAFSGVGTPEWEEHCKDPIKFFFRRAGVHAKRWWECFIATAAFGDPMAQELEVLRRFRDAVLLRSMIGSTIVSAYYRLSPPIAERIRDSEQMRRFTRVLLRPLLTACRVLMSADYGDQRSKDNPLS
jgi:transposase-like protein